MRDALITGAMLGMREPVGGVRPQAAVLLHASGAVGLPAEAGDGSAGGSGGEISSDEIDAALHIGRFTGIRPPAIDETRLSYAEKCVWADMQSWGEL